MKKIFLTLLVLICVSFFTAHAVNAQSRVFTATELSQFNGRNGQKAYYAYEGKVYDVTGSRLWAEGEHFGLFAGQDLTGKMTGAPHGTEVFAGFTVVGTYVASTTATASPQIQAASPSSVVTESPAKKLWYEGRVRIFGLSILAWTGIFLGPLFLLTFGTCFAMPWGKLPLPWKGSRIGKDELDAAPRHMAWTSIHKHFVWWFVIVGLIHALLGFLQLLGFYL